LSSSSRASCIEDRVRSATPRSYEPPPDILQAIVAAGTLDAWRKRSRSIGRTCARSRSCSQTSGWRWRRSSATYEVTMKRKARKTVLTPEDREREIRSEAIDRMLKDMLEREAEQAAKDPNYRGLGYWVEQVKAERDAENAA